MSSDEVSGWPGAQDALRSKYGRQLALVAEDGSEEMYLIAAEYRLNGQAYAALQTAAMKKLDELAFFRIAEQPDGEFELDAVTDEDEWEAAAEAYDDLLFRDEERP
ncbi:DUF1292 domain-containing protein [Paenibacillus daejeonensis]|uniref:DUF1292 domain-containing protein n=1 Tax=Paenibacillus daejeonensis TaxID=135193 RepID=UPI000368D953|nr:DUF1292 domain-containing protein [Paenibacillus daejeonensis]